MNIDGKKSARRISRKKSNFAFSTSNSRYVTRTSSPYSSEKVPKLEKKIMILEYKLAKARALIAKHQEDRKSQKVMQKEMFKNYHQRMMSLQQDTFSCFDDDIEQKILNERNAIEDIWRRRYEEMKKFYEGKIRDMEKNQGLCTKCKAFVKNSDQLEERIKSLKRFDAKLFTTDSHSATVYLNIMIDQNRFELMKKDLTKAAQTIQTLKKERDEYKISYEILKEDSVSKKDLLRNHSHLESLRDTNDSLQCELLKYRKLLKEREKEILRLQEKLKDTQKSFKSQVKTLKAIEHARQELNYEISHTQFKSNHFSTFSENLELLDVLVNSLKRNPVLYQMFKERVQCKKRFRTLVENANFSISFHYLIKFLLDVIGNFEFCDDDFSPQEPSMNTLYSHRLDESENISNRNISGLKESTEVSRAKVEKLDRKLLKTIESPKKELPDPRSPTFHKKFSSESNGMPFVSNQSRSFKSIRNTKINQNNLIDDDRRDQESLDQDDCFDDDLRQSRNFSKSKSPSLRVNSPKDRFQEFVVPYKKKDASSSVAECMGNGLKKK